MTPSDPSTPIDHPSQRTLNRFQDAVSRGVQSKVHQLIKAGILRPARTNEQCDGSWKPRMNLIDDLSSPSVIVIFELPGVRNENIILQIKDGRFIVIGTRDDPSAEALMVAKASLPTSAESGGTDANLDPHNPEKSLRIVIDDSVATPSTKPLTKPSMDVSIRELRYGSFFRSIALPDGIKQSEISARIENGMLTVTWPRVPAPRSSISEVAPNSDTPDAVMNAIDSTPPSVPTETASML